ncbi:MAG TPA: acyl-CoA dehydrogenase family protein [Acidimicrobiales bacterium]|jgi:putative acyl-CoA dehydrogenase|nr:acyl-CoA dehydrogenase family protein [Acidimicrobiales bacterium]
MPNHLVTNQPPPLQGYDLFAADPVLPAAVAASGAGWAAGQLGELGTKAGSEEAIGWGFEANANPPRLRTHDRFGHRLDRVEFHPTYHWLMEAAVAAGLHGSPWADPQPGAHVARAAAFYVWSQVEAGHGCPISMTYSIVPALDADAELSGEWRPRLTSRRYDPSFDRVENKSGALAGMAMTEKQGGSDVRANTTRAEADGAGYRLTGHKWFCSAPMSDLFLMLAQTGNGLSCFVVPRWTPDGVVNAIELQRLKDKLGNRSNASSEIELDRAWGRLLGPEGRGVATIMEMIQHTRLDCVIGAAAGMRQAVVQAVHHARHRRAFGAELVDQPLMVNVLADLALESQAATALMVRLAISYDRAGSDDHERAFRRLATAVGKYWVCKRHPGLVAEALECLGGNGYIEESIMPRLFRESPLNGIWEGSGNVIALDVLRTMARQPDAVEAFMGELGRAGGADSRYDTALARLTDELGDLDHIETRARRVVEQMAVLLEGSLLIRSGLPAVADAFCASRLGGDGGHAYGTLPVSVDARSIVASVLP